MSRSNGIGIIVWIYLITKGDVVRGQTGGSNAVALIKGQAMLDCSVRILATSSWIHTTDGTNNLLVIATGCSVTGNNAAYYRTEQPEGNLSCRLIIANVTMQQAGVYSCNDGATTVYRSLVTVIDPVASVVVYNQSEVVADDKLNISCSINYNGPSSPAPSLRPLPFWTTSPGQIYTNSTYHPSTNVVTLMATVTVKKYAVPIFHCNTVFEITGITIGYNATAPADNLTVGNTTQLDVQYNLSTPFITHSGVACGTIVLTCNSSGNPTPNYKWFYWNKTIIDVITEGQILKLTEVNQSHIICEAYNTIRNVNYTASTNYNVSAYRSNCDIGPNSPGKTDLITTIVLAAVLGGYGLCNIIATILFLVYYNRKSKTVSEDKEMSAFRNKSKLNARFPWLQRMLPCMNESRGNAGCTFLWVILFILMSILTGIIVFPILVAMVNCSRKRNDSKEDSDIGKRNNKQHSGAAGNPNTAAHGDVEDPYDEIKTMRLKQKHILEEPTSAKNTKDAKKVFYTRVNPNLNTEEDIERYCVSMPSGSPES